MAYISQVNVNGTLANIGLAERANQVAYFTTATDPATSLKVLTAANGSTISTNVTYSVGSIIAITFQKGSTVAAAIIPLGGAAVPIYNSTDTTTPQFAAGETVLLIKTADSWNVLDKVNNLTWQVF